LSFPEENPIAEGLERLNAVTARIEELDSCCATYDPHMMAMGGVFMSLREDGQLFIARGYRRPRHNEAQSNRRISSRLR
jgi:hypothetical protein